MREGRRFEMETRSIEACIISARGLKRSIIPLCKLRTMCVAWINPKHKYRSNINKNGETHPTWNMKFSCILDAQELEEDPELASLHVEIHSQEPIFYLPKLECSATIPLKEFMTKSNNAKADYTEYASFELRNPSGKARGMVDVWIRIVRPDRSNYAGAGQNQGFRLEAGDLGGATEGGLKRDLDGTAVENGIADSIMSQFHGGPLNNGQLEEENLFSDKILFRMETLRDATRNFHEENKLGQGGYGVVYKGITDGKEIAVKKLLPTFDQGPEQFLNEVKVLSRIQHRNCVKLLGCCVEGSEKLLVFEYLPNKSLDDTNKVKGLDWQQRYGIILGVACGLLYLHQHSEPQIVHRDIKPSNILLDNKLNPKIADFGFAKLFPEDKTHLTTGAVGTLGYVAPEYLHEKRLSKEADVYSFGVVLLELITGRNNKESLLGWVWSSHKQGNIGQTIDGAIIGSCDVEQALRCIRVGLLCAQANPSCRPSMFDVISMLSNGSKDVPPPKIPPPIFCTKNGSSI